jgi:hypothetical protein
MAGTFDCPPAWPATVIAPAMLAPTMRKTMLKMMQRGRRLLRADTLMLADLANVVTLHEANGSRPSLEPFSADNQRLTHNR